MRLGPFDTSKINVRSSNDGGGGGGMGGARGVGCGTLVIALIGAVVFGLDPMQTIGMVESVQQQAAPASGSGSSDMSEEQVCATSEYASEACAALATRAEGEWWAGMPEIYHLD